MPQTTPPTQSSPFMRYQQKVALTQETSHRLSDHNMMTNPLTILTLDQLLSTIGFGSYHHALLLLCGLGYFAVCAELLVLVFCSEQIMNDFDISRIEFSWLPFVSTLANFLGGLVFGIAADRTGRQPAFILSVVLTAMAGLSSAFADDFTTLCALRGLMSVGLGGITAIDHVLFLESVPATCRGKYNVAITGYGALGVLSVAGLAWVVMPVYRWRVLLALVSVPSFLVALVRVIISEESPTFLLAQGRDSEARAVLTRIAVRNNATFKVPQEVSGPPWSARQSAYQLSLTSFSEVASQCDTPPLATETGTLAFIWFFQFSAYWGLTLYLPAYLKLSIPTLNTYSVFFLLVAAELPGLWLVSVMIDSQTLGRLGSLRVFSGAATVACVTFTLLQSCFTPSPLLTSLSVMLIYGTAVPVFALLFTLTPESCPTNKRTALMGKMNAISSLPGLLVPFVSAKLLTLPPNVSTWLYPGTWACCFAAVWLGSCTLKREMSRMPLE